MQINTESITNQDIAAFSESSKGCLHESYLFSGNRCGHDPKNPQWDRFQPINHKELPYQIQNLLKVLRDYFFSPRLLPTLFNSSNKKNKDGELRQNRSEAREAECLVMSAIIMTTEYASMRVGTPLPDGQFIHRSCNELAKIAGLTVINTEGLDVASQRFHRAFRRLKNSGAFTVHQIYVTEADGQKRARPAVKKVNVNWLYQLGALTIQSFQRFRDFCSGRLKKLRQAYKEKYPLKSEAEIARHKEQIAQATRGVQVHKLTNNRPRTLKDVDEQKELKRQHNEYLLAHIAELQKVGYAGAELSAHRNQLLSFKDWLKKRKP